MLVQAATQTGLSGTPPPYKNNFSGFPRPFVQVSVTVLAVTSQLLAALDPCERAGTTSFHRWIPVPNPHVSHPWLLSARIGTKVVFA